MTLTESPATTDTTMIRLNAMTPGYLATLGMPLIAGRDFDMRDSSAAPKVAIVNRSFVRELGLSGNVVGQVLTMHGDLNMPNREEIA